MSIFQTKKFSWFAQQKGYKSMETLEGKVARQMIKEGTPLENVRIERLTCTKTKFDKTIHITDCVIGTLDMNKSIFHEKLLIRRCKIEQIILSDAIYMKGFDFRKNKVSHARLRKMQCHEKAHIRENRFERISLFQSEFYDDAVLMRNTLKSEANLSEMTCHGGLRMEHCIFDKQLDFSKTTIAGDTDFRHTQFAYGMDADNCVFGGELAFSHAQFRLNLNLRYSTFEGLVDFLRVIVEQAVLLDGIKLGVNQSYRFLNSAINRLIIRSEHIEDRLLSEKEGKYELAKLEYGILRNHFRLQNKFDAEDWAYYNFRRCKRLEQPRATNPVRLLLRGLDYFFLDKGCGYGTQPFRTLGVCFYIILFFAFSYFFILPHPKKATYGFTSKVTNQILYAFDTSLKVFSGGYGEVKTYGFYKFFVMSEYLLGVIFMGLFVVAFSRKVIR